MPATTLPMFIPPPAPAGGRWSHLPPPPAAWSHLPPPPARRPAPRSGLGVGGALALSAAIAVGLGVLALPLIGLLALLSFSCGCT